MLLRLNLSQLIESKMHLGNEAGSWDKGYSYFMERVFQNKVLIDLEVTLLAMRKSSKLLSAVIKGYGLVGFSDSSKNVLHWIKLFSKKYAVSKQRKTEVSGFHKLVKNKSELSSAFTTNQVMANPGMMFGDPTTPIGGNIVGHASTYRIYLRRGKQGSRVAKLIDSPNLPDNETVFYVTTKGVRDEQE